MKRHIVCFGDSNTHGYCAEKGGGRFDETERWTCRLQKQLGEEYVIYEEGLSGRTTCFRDPLHEGMSGLDYLYPCLMSHEPVDLLIVMLGTNDTKERFGVTAGAIGEAMHRLLTKAAAIQDCWRDGKVNILLVTPQNIGPEYADTCVADTMGKGCAEKSERLGEVYRALADTLGCHYLDANEVLTAPVNDVDFMHLTAEGHRQLADALEKKIREI